MEARVRREFPNNPPCHLASAETGSFSIPSRYHPPGFLPQPAVCTAPREPPDPTLGGHPPELSLVQEADICQRDRS